MPKFVDRHTVQDGSSLADVLLSVLQYQARDAVAATSLTDNSGGTADAEFDLAKVALDAANAAASGLDLADKASTEGAFGTVKNALATLFAKANAAANTLGIDQVTYSGGGTNGGNTVAAVTVSVTGAATGAQATEYNTVVGDLNEAFYVLGGLVNKLCAAAGKDALDLAALKGETWASSVAAIGTGTGTAADPGVKKAVADADLAVFANNVATVAARINAVVGGAGSPGAVAR